MDTVFYLTIVLIFVAALVGIFVSRRKLDRCLRDFAGFNVSVYLKDGTRVWGRLLVFSSGCELLYKEPYQDSCGHEETSFIFLEKQVASIQSICRFHDELTPGDKETRLRRIERIRQLPLVHRLGRYGRNFMNTFSDAFNQTVGLLVAQAKKTSQSAVIHAGDKEITGMGRSVVGAVGNAYEPILERYIGRKIRC